MDWVGVMWQLFFIKIKKGDITEQHWLYGDCDEQVMRVMRERKGAVKKMICACVQNLPTSQYKHDFVANAVEEKEEGAGD